MNCKSVKELLPLYVSRDLKDDRAHLIAAHVHACSACAGSAAEYHETLQLMQEFAPPAFSDAVYSGIRANVWREIERDADSRPATLSQLVAGVFRPRIRWALVSALVLAACLIAFYFVANRGNEQHQLAGVQPVASPRKPEITASGSPENVATGQRIHRPQVRKRIAPAAGREPARAVDGNRQPSAGSEAALDSNRLAEPSAVQSSEKVFRLEMQTKDPNIRIIWLTPQRIKHDSPGKVS
jgi:anti-sigma factor RsiW